MIRKHLFATFIIVIIATVAGTYGFMSHVKRPEDNPRVYNIYEEPREYTVIREGNFVRIIDDIIKINECNAGLKGISGEVGNALVVPLAYDLQKRGIVVYRASVRNGGGGVAYGQDLGSAGSIIRLSGTLYYYIPPRLRTADQITLIVPCYLDGEVVDAVLGPYSLPVEGENELVVGAPS